ncbi:hypothetical protein K438DRAFT_1758033 [Mycena galopus ATCC 62051]|nr:hypothetical protein K438DRAFT_1758033 [Mycena galopus ATCC 62051]
MIKNCGFVNRLPTDNLFKLQVRVVFADGARELFVRDTPHVEECSSPSPYMVLCTFILVRVVGCGKLTNLHSNQPTDELVSRHISTIEILGWLGGIVMKNNNTVHVRFRRAIRDVGDLRCLGAVLGASEFNRWQGGTSNLTEWLDDEEVKTCHRRKGRPREWGQLNPNGCSALRQGHGLEKRPENVARKQRERADRKWKERADFAKSPITITPESEE